MTEEDIWETFCPIRSLVRSAVESGKDVDEVITKRWQEIRNHIVAKYYYLVKRVAESMHQKITELEEDALASMGVDGLYDTVDAFEPGLNIKFETYAVYRIRGSILDAIRRDDWVPRLVRQRAKKMSRTHDKLRDVLGRTPTDVEMAEAMDISEEEYKELIRSSALKSISSLNATFKGGDQDNGSNSDMTMQDCIRDTKVYDPLDNMIQEELKAKLFGKGFTPLERRIIYAYYFEARCMREIADAVGLSESRVSQMNTAIIERLREKIRRNPEYFGKDVLEALGVDNRRGQKLLREAMKKPQLVVSQEAA